MSGSSGARWRLSKRRELGRVSGGGTPFVVVPGAKARPGGIGGRRPLISGPARNGAGAHPTGARLASMAMVWVEGQERSSSWCRARKPDAGSRGQGSMAVGMQGGGGTPPARVGCNGRAKRRPCQGERTGPAGLRGAVLPRPTCCLWFARSDR